MTSSKQCATCGGELQPRTGPGRPAAYCSESCRRLAEYELRRLDRRIAAYEVEQRELKAERPQWPAGAEQRERRLRCLRTWIAADRKRLQALIAAGRGSQQTGASAARNSNDEVNA